MPRERDLAFKCELEITEEKVEVAVGRLDGLDLCRLRITTGILDDEPSPTHPSLVFTCDAMLADLKDWDVTTEIAGPVAEVAGALLLAGWKLHHG